MAGRVVQSLLVASERIDSRFIIYFATTFICFSILYGLLFVPLISSPLRKIPGPKIFAITKWRLAFSDFRSTRTVEIDALHRRYGTAVRVGANEVSFSSLSALRTIYGAGSGSERTDYYRMFDVYGRQNLFSFPGSKQHAERKKILAHAYSKSAILSPQAIAMPLIENNVKRYLEVLEHEKTAAQNIFMSLHWFSLDSITGFLYGHEHGGTNALAGVEADRRLLDDIIHSSRRRLSWFAVHMQRYTKWAYTRTGFSEKLISMARLLPMQKPATNTGIRDHALKSWNSFAAAAAEANRITEPDLPILQKLWRRTVNSKHARLDGLDIASEVADHFLAGIDTTSDTIMFAIWALSRPENKRYQEMLIQEAKGVSVEECNQDGNPTPDVADRLPYLDAVLKETLRLYPPIPASEPRSFRTDTVIDGYAIPAGTIVSMSPYTLHRNPDVFPDPLVFKPERWLGQYGDVSEMKRWFWAFSSGGRMCIGLHLAMAEMNTLLVAIYRRYSTTLHPKQVGSSPGISSRFELFGDDTLGSILEHQCWIQFHKNP